MGRSFSISSARGRKQTIPHLKFSLALFGSILISSVGAPAYAQDAAGNTAKPPCAEGAADTTGCTPAPAKLDTVTVTGTRLKRLGFETTTPVTVVNAVDLKNSGATNLGDYLNNLPQLSSSASMSNSTQYLGTAGLNQLDLRDLGTSRTLVLINGRRQVGGYGGDTAVDINTIPIELIDRVEIITGGASAIYGADAVTGVVNFVLKKNFSGLTIDGQIGGGGDSSFRQKNLSITKGLNFDDNRGNIAFSFDYADQNRLQASQRSFSRYDKSYLTNPSDPDFGGAPNGIPDSILVNRADINLASRGGTIWGPNYLNGDITDAYTFDADHSFRKVRVDGIQDPVNLACSDCDYLNLNDFQDLQPKYDRLGFNILSHYRLSDSANVFFEGKFYRTNATTYTQPSFDYAFGSTHIIAQRDNPYLPAGLAAYMDDPANNLTSVEINRFNADAGLRGEKDRRDTYRAVVGVEGTLPFAEQWTYNASAVYGETDIRTTFINNRINGRFSASVDAVEDPNTHQAVCRGTIDPTALDPNTGEPYTAFDLDGCVASNVFGDGSISPQARAFFNATGLEKDKVSQTVLGGYLTNESLFALPAGPVGVVLGAEYRHEQSSTHPDALSATGLTFNNALLPLSGGFHVYEAYAEANLPLLANIPGVKKLELGVAGRYARYNTIGSTFTSKASLDWAVVSDVRIRTSLARAIRAPNIGELFSPQSQNFFSVSDPCSASEISSAKDPAVRATNCAALGIPADFQSQADNATIPGVSGGNPELKQEKATTFTFGVVLTPTWVQDLQFSADFWNIRIDDAISAIEAQTILEHCVDDPSGVNNNFCALSTRDGTSHELTNIVQISQNVQKFVARGIDFESSYSFALPVGKANVHLIATYLDRLRDYPFQTDPSEFTESARTAGDPRWNANLDMHYLNGPLTLSWEVRFIASTLLVSQQTASSKPDYQSPMSTGARFYNDVQGRYKLPGGLKNVELYMGVNNLLNVDPPATFLGTGTASATYDNIGRFFYGGVVYRIE